MPLPDADKRSPRVYTLSQNTDLENLAFATMQSIGNPINIEELNEDELRRLVLVNLARLSVKGEWDGLLSAGGGGGGGGKPQPVGTELDASGVDYDRFLVCNQYSQYFAVGPTSPEVLYLPFISPKSADVTELGVYAQSAPTSSVNFYMGIYNNDDNLNIPGDLIGYGSIDAYSGGAGSYYDTTLSATITLVAGTTYWMGVVTDSASTFNVLSAQYIYTPFWGAVDDAAVASYHGSCLMSDTSATALPATGDAEKLRPSDAVRMPAITVKF